MSVKVNPHQRKVFEEGITFLNQISSMGLSMFKINIRTNMNHFLMNRRKITNRNIFIALRKSSSRS